MQPTKWSSRAAEVSAGSSSDDGRGQQNRPQRRTCSWACVSGSRTSAGTRAVCPNPRWPLWSRFGRERLDGSPTGWRLGMRVIDCPGERRVRENRMHGVGGGGRKRADDAQPYTARWVVYRWRASRLPHTPILRTRPQAGRVERNSEHEPQESEQRTRADPPLGPPSLSKQQVAGWRVILWTPQRQSGRSPLALLNLPVRPRRPDRH